MKQVTAEQIQNEFAKVITNTFVGLKTRTIPKMRKTDNPYFDQITKESEINGQIGFDYETNVNNQLGRENKEMDFKAQAHKWAIPTDSKNILSNKAGTKFYLRVKVQTTKSPTYLHNGEVIDKELLKDFLVKSSKPHTQENLEKEVIVRTYAMESITEVRMMGETYEIVHDTTHEAEQVARQVQVA